MEQFNAYDETILQVVVNEEGLTNLPIITRMDFGHTDPMTVLPLGVDCEIDCDAQQILIIENTVVD